MSAAMVGFVMGAVWGWIMRLTWEELSKKADREDDL